MLHWRTASCRRSVGPDRAMVSGSMRSRPSRRGILRVPETLSLRFCSFLHFVRVIGSIHPSARSWHGPRCGTRQNPPLQGLRTFVDDPTHVAGNRCRFAGPCWTTACSPWGAQTRDPVAGAPSTPTRRWRRACATPDQEWPGSSGVRAVGHRPAQHEGGRGDPCAQGEQAFEADRRIRARRCIGARHEPAVHGGVVPGC